MKISTILNTQLKQHFVNGVKIYFSEDSHAVPDLPSCKVWLRQGRALESRHSRWREFGYLYWQQSKEAEYSESVCVQEVAS